MKKSSILVCALGIVLMAGRFLPVKAQQEDTNSPATVNTNDVARGISIAPVQLSFAGKDRALVGWGSYLVNTVGSCNDCHSCPSYKGTNPYLVGGKALGPWDTPGPVNSVNYLAGGVQFGPFTSRNITPDKNGKPAGLTLNQFINAMHSGIDTDGSILQVMPWPTIRHMTNPDLTAIYTYLSAIPPASPGSCTGAGQTGP